MVTVVPPRGSKESNNPLIDTLTFGAHTDQAAEIKRAAEAALANGANGTGSHVTSRSG